MCGTYAARQGLAGAFARLDISGDHRAACFGERRGGNCGGGGNGFRHYNHAQSARRDIVRGRIGFRSPFPALRLNRLTKLRDS